MSSSSDSEVESEEFKELRRKLLEYPIGEDYPEFEERKEHAAKARQLWNTVLSACQGIKRKEAWRYQRGRMYPGWNMVDGELIPYDRWSQFDYYYVECSDSDGRSQVDDEVESDSHETASRGSSPCTSDNQEQSHQGHGIRQVEADTDVKEPLLQPKQTSSFLSIPLELRLHIYKLYMENEKAEIPQLEQAARRPWIGTGPVRMFMPPPALSFKESRQIRECEIVLKLEMDVIDPAHQRGNVESPFTLVTRAIRRIFYAFLRHIVVNPTQRRFTGSRITAALIAGPQA